MLKILLMIILFVFIVYLLSWLFNGPTALSNFESAKTPLTIPATSLPAGASVNYAYSVWFYIDDWSYRYGSEKIIFSRGNKKYMPGVVLAGIDNNIDIKVAMTGTEDIFTCTLTNIPIQKWTNLIVTLNNRSLDCYINGKLLKTCVLPAPAFVDDTQAIYLTPLTGFSGYTSRFNYWNDTINPQQAWNIYQGGPGGNILSNFLNQYKVQLTFMKGNSVQASLTI